MILNRRGAGVKGHLDFFRTRDHVQPEQGMKDLVNCHPIDHDLEATLACESRIHQESLDLVIIIMISNGS